MRRIRGDHDDRGSALLELLLAALVVAVLFAMSAPRYVNAMRRVREQTEVLDQVVEAQKQIAQSTDDECPVASPTGTASPTAPLSASTLAICDLFLTLSATADPTSAATAATENAIR